MKHNDGWQPCPRCESNKVKQISRSMMMFAIWCLGIIFLLVGIILWFLLPIAGILFLAAPFALFAPRMNQCKDCNYSWAAKKQKA
ncbi:hypothetical protein [Lacicoccus qingdaonensis]|uniref:Uncharacterized protein n=1 Tax=Lacicoccus qingdaonensis TaxID=576118 RepID=A0A1G9FU48_9BACL|nr:hypothetical protein [Salinicoccus qingdaonensis]SDK91918.1 hypothetical protein SAMN05216216_1143 [Salinicoccus qingdaonensis]